MRIIGIFVGKPNNHYNIGWRYRTAVRDVSYVQSF
jgi:hypothetical protein